jgi:hypothetical protein
MTRQSFAEPAVSSACRQLGCLAGVLALGMASVAHAFPPAPHMTHFGFIRDQVGQILTAEGASLVLLKDGREVGRTPVHSQLITLDRNYELTVRIDAARPGTEPYSAAAIAAGGLYSLAVEMNGSWFYPIEVSGGGLLAGQGGERVRLDLNLGEDTDGDGLPDIWEMWQLYQAGHHPDETGKWPLHLINRDGDFDGDGQSNWLEYIAGTFAGDAEDRFMLQIKERTQQRVRLEFYAITGKTYTIESSADLETWTPVAFRVDPDAAPQQTHTATDVAILPAYVAHDGQEGLFYRLTVR